MLEHDTEKYLHITSGSNNYYADTRYTFLFQVLFPFRNSNQFHNFKVDLMLPLQVFPLHVFPLQGFWRECRFHFFMSWLFRMIINSLSQILRIYVERLPRSRLKNPTFSCQPGMALHDKFSDNSYLWSHHKDLISYFLDLISYIPIFSYFWYHHKDLIS